MSVKLPPGGKPHTHGAPKGKHGAHASHGAKPATQTKTPVAHTPAHKADPNAGKRLNVEG